MRPASEYKTTELEIISEETHKINLLTAAPIIIQPQHLACQNVSKLRIFCGEETVHGDSFLILCLLFATQIRLCAGFKVFLCFAFSDANTAQTDKVTDYKFSFLSTGLEKDHLNMHLFK